MAVIVYIRCITQQHDPWLGNLPDPEFTDLEVAM